MNEPSGPRDPLTMFGDRLPEGSVPEIFVGVLSYIDPTGELAYCVIHSGNAAMSSFVGLLELGKIKVVDHFEGRS